MTKLHQLGLLFFCASISATTFAADCNTLENYGLQKSVINTTDGKSISIDDINSCLAQCDDFKSSGDPTQDATKVSQCISGLSTLKFAVNYENAKNAINPNQFDNGPGVPPSSGLGSQSTAPNNSIPDYTPQQPAAHSFEQPILKKTPSTTGGYIMNPQAAKKLSAAAKNKNAIRWY